LGTKLETSTLSRMGVLCARKYVDYVWETNNNPESFNASDAVHLVEMKS